MGFIYFCLSLIIINLSYCNGVILQVTADMKLDTQRTDGDPSRQAIMEILDMFDNCDVLANNSSEWGICWIHDGKNYPTHHIVKFYITISCNVSMKGKEDNLQKDMKKINGYLKNYTNETSGERKTNWPRFVLKASIQLSCGNQPINNWNAAITCNRHGMGQSSMAQTISVCVDDGHELNHTASTIPIREPSETASTIPTREPSETASTIPTRELSETASTIPTREPSETASTIPTREPYETVSTIPTREPSETASTIPTREPSEILKSVKTSTKPRSKTEDIKSSDITGQSATIQNTVKLILGNTNRQTYTPNNTIATPNTRKQSTSKHTSGNFTDKHNTLKVLSTTDVVGTHDQTSNLDTVTELSGKVLNATGVVGTQDGTSKIIGSIVGTVAALSGLVATASFLRRKCKKNSVNPDTGNQSDTASISSDQPFFIPTEFSQDIASGTPAVKHSDA